MVAMARALATIEQIAEIAPIPDADAIVRARVRGWDVVVKLDEFRPGDLCVYFEVDTMLDVTDERFAFLAPRGVRTDVEGHSGHVLRTARLRGQYSQGLALPVACFPELGDVTAGRCGEDVTDRLGVRKWDPPIPANLSGQVLGNRPSWIPATDEDRIQNLPHILDAGDGNWICTEKIDGSSTTFFVDDDTAGVCSRNLNLVDDDRNTLWRLAHQLDIHTLIRDSDLGARVAVQGETFGEGIQGNPLRLKGQHFRAFTLRVGGHELPRDHWPAWLLELAVPTYDHLPFPGSVDEALAQVEAIRSTLADRPAEGVVWRHRRCPQVTLPDGRIVRASFKAISNRYLLKHSD